LLRLLLNKHSQIKKKKRKEEEHKETTNT